MQQNSFIIFLCGLCFTLAGCIESYYPKEISNAESTYVVSGSVTSTPGYQLVRVSKTSSIISPKYTPVKYCTVEIIDSDNNVFSCNCDGYNGEYRIWIDEEYLTPGKGFKVNVLTPDGIAIESDISYLNPCPPLGNFYFQLLDKPTTDPEVPERGIQFKVDLEADESFDRFFRWEIEETYEYHSYYPIQFFYDDSIVVLPLPDYSKYYCWTTNYISNIYALSTKGLAENKFVGFNLHFVNNRSQKLMHLYSIIITQHAINEGHFNYLEQVRVNASEQGGLFDSQPVSIKGNMYSTNNPEIEVLGYFSASSVRNVRLFFSNISNLDFDLPEMCTPSSLLLGFSAFHPDEYPIYLVSVEGEILLANKSCFDCTLRGGTNVKPSFWPE